MNTRPIPYLLLLILITLPLDSYALPSDREQPIEITSESAELREKDGYAIYNGSARMKQGSLEVDADKIELYFKNKKFHRAVIFGEEGRRAYFQQTPNPGEDPVRGTAKRIVYETDAHEIRLLGSAVFCQQGSEQKGERIIYDTESDIMQAKARTRTVFRPESAPGRCDHISSDYRK